MSLFKWLCHQQLAISKHLISLTNQTSLSRVSLYTELRISEPTIPLKVCFQILRTLLSLSAGLLPRLVIFVLDSEKNFEGHHPPWPHKLEYKSWRGELDLLSHAESFILGSDSVASLSLCNINSRYKFNVKPYIYLKITSQAFHQAGKPYLEARYCREHSVNSPTGWVRYCTWSPPKLGVKGPSWVLTMNWGFYPPMLYFAGSAGQLFWLNAASMWNAWCPWSSDHFVLNVINQQQSLDFVYGAIRSQERMIYYCNTSTLGVLLSL